MSGVAKWLIAAVAVVSIAFGGILVYRHKQARQDEDAFQAQLKLARAEGIPTTGAEYAAQMPAVPTAENAAPLYRDLKDKLKGLDYTDLRRDPVFDRSSKGLRAAKDLLAKYGPALQIADKAAKLPHCWFNRDWSLGAAVLLPEFADMKRAAQLVAYRGSVEAASGNSRAALADASEAFRIGDHAGSEPHAISHLVREAIYYNGLRSLADWCYVYPDRAEYRTELKRALDALPKPNLRQEHSMDLIDVLTMIDLCSTPEGRTKLGLREQDVSPAEKVLPLLMSQSKAKVRIVEAERKYWKALALPLSKREVAVDAALRERNSAFLAFPTAASIFSALDSGVDDSTLREPLWEARKQVYEAFLRAVSTGKIGKSIDTSGLLSPFDGKPIRYSYDGKRITIQVSGSVADVNPVKLEILPARK